MQLETKKDELSELSRKLAGLKEKRAALDRDRKDVENKSGRRDTLANQLKTEKFCLKERSKLGNAEKGLKSLEESNSEYAALNARIEELENQRVIESYNQKASLIGTRSRVTSELAASRTKLAQTKERITNMKRDLTQESDEAQQNKSVFEEIQTLESQRENLQDERNKFNAEYETKKRTQDLIAANIKELTTEIKEKEEAQRKKTLYSQRRIWLDQHFIPCVQDIERHVLIGIKEEFNQLFERWFGELIETGDISVRVDEGFTPIIEQGGYELDVGSLSSGERTSVVLAYRLALNVMVKKVCNAMQSNLLILDEPTDGFSKEQLARLRDVLRELNSEQVVMVSHEKELESFVDRVYRVVKENGISRVKEAIT
jgi:exonuclease SbcC